MANRIIVAGGRDFDDYERLTSVCIDFFKYEDVMVNGMCATGADALARKWAEYEGAPISFYPADWKKYGRAAGPMRNEVMARTGDILITFWDGKSKGTKSMIDLALKGSLEVHVYPYHN